MTALLRRFRPDVVHVHKVYPQLSVAPLVVASRAGVPIVQTVHDYEQIGAHWLDHTGGRIDRRSERMRDRVLNSATFVVRRTWHRRLVNRWIAVSRFTAEQLRLEGIRAAVLPNPTSPIPASVPGFAEREGVTFTGALLPEKGVRHVIEMAARLADVTVTVAGAGPLEAEVRAACVTRPNLRFSGMLDGASVARLMRSARVHVMPSLWEEPGPLTVLEAMAQGTPVVGYPRGGLAEYVADAGGVIARENPGDLATRAGALHAGEEEWTTRSASARRAVLERHTLQGYLDRLEGVYHDAIGGALAA
jgi:glycosyltransferase involved in cell wall biosynthesis